MFMDIHDYIRTSDVLSTEVEDTTNAITAQIGSASSQETETSGAEWWQHIGFVSRPSNPNPESQDPSAQVISLSNRSYDQIIASKDNRSAKIYGDLKAGETALYASGQDGEGQAFLALKGNGAITIYTTDNNKEDGAGVALVVSPTKLAFTAPWGTIEFSAAGFFVRHHTGSAIELGGISGLPGPLSSLSSYANLRSSSIKLDAPTVTLGSSPTGIYNQVGYSLVPITVPLQPLATTPAVTTLSAAMGVFVAAT